jgi:intein/homing endonuclease
MVNKKTTNLDNLFDGFITSAAAGIGSNQNNSISIIEFAEDIVFNGSAQLFPQQTALLKTMYGEDLNDIEKNVLAQWKYEGRTNWVEGRSYKNLILEVGRGGCPSEDSYVITTVGTITYGELRDRKLLGETIGITTLNPDTWESYTTYDIKTWDKGEEPAIRIKTAAGKEEECTYDHPYLIWRKGLPEWVELKDLVVGDRIAVLDNLPLFGTTSIGVAKAKLLGYLLGDGGLSQRSSIRFTNMDSRIIEEIQSILDESFPTIRIRKGAAKYGYTLSAKPGQGNPLLCWLREIGEHGKLAIHKRIPPCIKQAPKEEIATFLSRLFACDGYACVGKLIDKHPNPKCIIGICLASKEFIEDIQRELVKFGIASRVNYKASKCNGKLFDAWALTISDKQSLSNFIHQIGIFSKEDKLKAIEAITSNPDIRSQCKVDTLPCSVWDRINDKQETLKFSNRQVTGGINTDHSRLRKQYAPSKSKVITYATNLKDEELKTLAQSNIRWDGVEELIEVGMKRIVGLEVTDTSIIGNSIISHNSKCCSEDSFITTTVGSLSYGDLHQRLSRGERIGIFTYNPATWEKYISYDIATEFNGVKEVYELRTKSGRADKVTAEHPYLVWRDDWDVPRWVEVKDLEVGDYVAVAKSQELFGGKSIGLDKAALLGYIWGDGSVRGESITFTNEQSMVIEDIQDILNREFPSYRIKLIGGTKIQYRISHQAGMTGGTPNPLMNWIKSLGEWDKLSKNKRIPTCIKEAPKEEVASFLSRLFSCDGYCSSTPTRVTLGITLASKDFIDDIQRELLKFGITSHTFHKIATCNSKNFDAWELAIRTKRDILKFSQDIGIYSKGEALNQAIEIISKRLDRDQRIELLPKGALNLIEKAKYKSKVSWTSLGLTPNSYIRKDRLSKAKAKDAAHKLGIIDLSCFIDAPILWEPIASLTLEGTASTIALEVKGTNIIGNDIISHNSTIAAIIALYEFYSLITLPNPARHYKLLPNDPIALFVIAQTLEQVKDTLFAKIRGYAADSYFFKAMQDSGKIEILAETIKCPAKNVAIYAKHTNSPALVGYTLKAMILDEFARFENKIEDDGTITSAGDHLFSNVGAGVNRFGALGHKVAISSAWCTGDPMERLINDTQADPDTVFFRLRTWDLNKLEAVSRANCNSDYIKNRVKAELEYEGIRRKLSTGFISAQLCDKACTGFSCIDTLERDKNLEISSETKRYVEVDITRLEKNTSIRSFIHVDFSVKRDATALAMCHAIKMADDRWGISLDALIRWKPYLDSTGHQRYVSYQNVEDCIIELGKARHASKITFDSFNSESSIQKLHTLGFSTEQMSTARVQQLTYYTTFRDLLSQGLLELPRDSVYISTLITELSEIIVKPNGQVTHNLAGKDMADAVVNAVYACYLDMISSGLTLGTQVQIASIKSGNLKNIPNSSNTKLNIGRAINTLYKKKR